MAKARTLTLNTKVNVTGADKIKGLGQSLQNTGKQLTMNYTLPLVAAGAAAFKFASDVDESANKAETVFGAAAAGLRKEAQSMTDALGEATFLDTAGTFGALLTNMGFVQQEAADLSLEWLRLSEDMASFHNTNPEESLQAIRSALAGEFEPLKRFGVMLNVATIEQRALEMGLWDGVGAIDAQTRALVVNAELFRQQPAVIGDYERTAGGAANTTRRLWSNFKDTAATLGKELLPVGTAILNWANDLVTGFRDLNPEVRTWIVRIAGIVAAAGPVLFIVGSLVKAFVGLKVAFLAMKALPAIITPVALKIGAAMTLMLGPIGLVVAALGALALAFATDFAGIRTTTERSMDILALHFGDLGDTANKLAADMGTNFDDIKKRVKARMEETGQSVEQALSHVERELRDLPITADAHFKAYSDVTAQHMLAAKGIVTQGVDGMVDELGSLPEKGADEMLANQFHLTDATTELLNFMDQALSPAEELFNARMFLASAAAAEGLASNNPLVKTKTEEMVAEARAVIDSFGKEAFNYGFNFSGAYAAGIVNNLGVVKDAGRQLASGVASQARIESEPPDHNSPLYGITKWGANLAETYAEGIRSKIRAVAAAIQAMAAAAVPATSFGAMTPALAGVPAGSGPGAGGGDVHIHLTVQGDLTPEREAQVTNSILRGWNVVSMARGNG